MGSGTLRAIVYRDGARGRGHAGTGGGQGGVGADEQVLDQGVRQGKGGGGGGYFSFFLLVSSFSVSQKLTGADSK